MNIDIRQLTVKFGNQSILNGLDVMVQPGKLVCIAGPNGAGKTTLLKCIARLLRPNAGSILFDDVNIATFKANAMARALAYMPQSSQTTFPMTVEEYITLGRRPYVRWSLRQADRNQVDDTMRYLKIDCMRDKYMDELSGGERQRVLLARALVQEPSVLLLDEPTSALDVRHQLDVMELLREIAQKRAFTIILVMHDLPLAARYADEILLLKDGKVYAQGTPQETLTRENLREVYKIDAEILQTTVGMAIVPITSITEE